MKRLIKRADQACAYFEAVQLAGFEPQEARKFFGEPKGVTPVTLTAMTTLEAQDAYLKRFAELSEARPPA